MKMILTKTVQVKWHRKTAEHYIGIKVNDVPKYSFTRYGDTFEVDFEDIYITYSNEIDIECDYCGIEHIKRYNNWKKFYDQSPIKKDACSKCRGKKTKESNLLLFGVENVMHIQETKDKIVKTNLEKYGVPSATMTDEVKNKMKETVLNKYGSEYYFQTDEFKTQYVKTMQENYGVDNAFQSEQIKDKSKLTMLLNYGVEYNMQNPTIRAKAVQSMYERGSTPTSKPQIYLHQVFKGELNFPYERYNLDIALVDEKIAIEYDGGAHDLKVTLGGISEKDFKTREIIRGAYIKKGGWKLLTIKSKVDKLPTEDILLKMLNDAKDIFNQGRSWVSFCIDSETISYKDTVLEYDFNQIDKYKDVLKRIDREEELYD